VSFRLQVGDLSEESSSLMEGEKLTSYHIPVDPTVCSFLPLLQLLSSLSEGSQDRQDPFVQYTSLEWMVEIVRLA